MYQKIISKHVYKFTFTLGVTVLSLFVGHVAFSRNDIQLETSVSVTLYNSFSGTQSLLNTGCITNGNFYVGSDIFQVGINSTATGSYEIAGDVVTIVTGGGVGTWTELATGYTLTGDGTITLSTTLYKGLERYKPDDLSYELDLTPPNAPLVTRPWVLNYNGYYFLFRWEQSVSVDTGAGFTDYILYISEDPSFDNPVKFVTNQQFLMISASLLPFNSNFYRYVASRDCVNNEQPSIVSWLNFLGEDEEEEDDNDNNNSSPSGSAGNNSSSSSSDDNIYRPEPITNPDWPFSNLPIPKYAAKRLHDAPSQPGMTLGIGEFPYPLDVITVFALPQKLQKTGAPADPLPQLLLLIKHLPDHMDKEYLYSYVNWLIHIRYLGVMIIFWMLAYDIQTVGAWYYYLIYKD